MKGTKIFSYLKVKEQMETKQEWVQKQLQLESGWGFMFGENTFHVRVWY